MGYLKSLAISFWLLVNAGSYKPTLPLIEAFLASYQLPAARFAIHYSF